MFRANQITATPSATFDLEASAITPLVSNPNPIAKSKLSLSLAIVSITDAKKTHGMKQKLSKPRLSAAGSDIAATASQPTMKRYQYWLCVVFIVPQSDRDLL